MSQQEPSDQSVVQKELASRVLARRRLLHFIQRHDATYMAGWVHQDICRRLERFSEEVTKGMSPRLMLLMPPRHGKSRIASISFPAWHLGRNPSHEFISASYNVALSMGFSRKVQGVLEDPRYCFDLKLDPGNKSAESWGLEAQVGGFVAAGVGGGITGKGAHILSIDDPIKNAEEADSMTTREALWDWYTSTAYTRLAPGGGVLVIQCMTGDTPVLLPDGTERRLDLLRAGDKVATYENGRLSESNVMAHRSNGRDYIYKITMSSGRVVRSNGRHPFMVSDSGELKWVRARSLNTTHAIVAVKDSGVSGKARHAPSTDVENRPSAVGTALRTTKRKNGLMDIVRRLSTRNRKGPRTSSIDTGSRLKTTLGSLLNKAASALYAAMEASLCIGQARSVSITATRQAGFVGFSATTATSQQDTFPMSGLHSPWPRTFDFTLDQVVSVERDGEEEVFDVQIARTENFIANGLVSHNTCWHDDDLAGRLQQAMSAGGDDPDVDKFEIIKYPAIAESDEWLDPLTDEIVRIETKRDLVREDMYELVRWTVLRVPAVLDAQAELFKQQPEAKGYKLLRVKGEPLHVERYDLPKLARIKKTLPKRFWSALYQQNPVPDDGSFFTRDQFKRAGLPSKNACNVFIAFDFAITEKQANDFTVGVVGLQDEDDTLHVADVVRFKSGDAFFIVDAIVTLIKKWHVPGMRLGFENGQIFMALESLLRKEMRKQKLTVPYETLQPVTDKKVRASPLQGRMQQARISYAVDAEWFTVVQNEMLRFPSGIHDDTIDAQAWLARMVAQYEAPRRARLKQEKSWKDKLPSTRVRGSGSHMVA